MKIPGDSHHKHPVHPSEPSKKSSSLKRSSEHITSATKPFYFNQNVLDQSTPPKSLAGRVTYNPLKKTNN